MEKLKSRSPYNTILNEKKNWAWLWMQCEVIKMNKYCRMNKLTNIEIAAKSGLPKSYISRFRNNKTPNMEMVNFIVISKAIGYEIKFRESGSFD